ncbi:MAG TPA: AgmX/PglI C-terminal domain-containing protein [Cellvibrio sp.]|nr:AgmX/PglI C-terminal domain-containing protein [Cellvibrio sp.]
MAAHSLYGLQLPWSVSNDDTAFKKILFALLAIYMFIALPITLINLPELTRAEKEQLPPQLARIMLERQELPPPQPIVPPPEVAKPEETQLQERPREEKKPEVKRSQEKPVAKIAMTASDKPAKDSNVEVVAQARERAANSGLMQFKDDLMEMRETLKTSAVESAATNTTTSEPAATGAAQVDRSMITSGVSKGSGGINAATYSRDTGGTALAGRETTKVKSGLADAGKKAAGATASGGGNSDGAGGAARSEEEVRKVMEQHKGAIFNIYNKALRDDATLQGKVVVKMVIDPSGRILEASIVSSELNNPEVEGKLLQRIKLISFSASNVIRTTLNYSFDFLPQ